MDMDGGVWARVCSPRWLPDLAREGDRTWCKAGVAGAQDGYLPTSGYGVLRTPYLDTLVGGYVSRYVGTYVFEQA